MPKMIGKVPVFTDYEVACAFNSCFDLEKFKALHTKIKVRSLELLRHHRLWPVCFFKEAGFGLKIFNDAAGVAFKPNGDEATLITCEADSRNGQVDIDGYWVRCPGKDWDPEKAKPQPKFLIMDRFGRKYLEKFDSEKYSQKDYEDDPWTFARENAWVLTKEEAGNAFTKIPGAIVIEYDGD